MRRRSLILVLAEIKEASLKLPMRHQALVLLMVIVAQYYVQISSMVLATFACKEVKDGTAGLMEPTTVTYWIHDMRRECYTDQQHMMLVSMFGGPMSLLFCVGVIAMFAVQIARYQRYKAKLHEEMRHSQTSFGTGGGRTERWTLHTRRFHVVLRSSGS